MRAATRCVYRGVGGRLNARGTPVQNVVTCQKKQNGSVEADTVPDAGK